MGLSVGWDPRRHRRARGPPATGRWKVFVHVDMVKSLSLSESRRFLGAMAVTAIGMSYGVGMEYGISPARDLGPRLFLASGVGDRRVSPSGRLLWVSIVGPVVGAAIAEFIYRWLTR
jgi:glycerol uptake facilitator-like aquaporin